MDRILSTMGIFIEYPWIPALVGACLLGLGRSARRRAVVGAGLLWLLYAGYEMGMKQRWLCSGECNIRLDLFLIYPLLLAGLTLAAVSLLRVSGSRRAGS